MIGKIVVAGSINMDQVFTVKEIPKTGETVLAYAFETHAGGKGANQAVAAARAGADVSMLGCVGTDETGTILLDRLQRNGVDTGKIMRLPDCGTGIAAICVDFAGNNSITVFPGANAKLDREKIVFLKDWLTRFDLCIVQLEIPLETVLELITLCKNCGIPMALNPSPAATLPDEALHGLDYIIPNEHELFQMLGIPEPPEPAAFKDYLSFTAGAARKLVDKGCKNVIVTLGKSGAVLVSRDRTLYFKATVQVPVDTTGAGDCFLGVFSAGIASGVCIEDAVKTAVAASGLSVTKKGAQESMPSFQEVQECMKSHLAEEPTSLL